MVPRTPSVKSEPADPREVEAGRTNGCVGREVLVENARVRVWRTRLRPGERLAFHCLALDHLWIAEDDCELEARGGTGRLRSVVTDKGEVRFRRVARDAAIVQDLRNIGTSTSTFLLVEFLDSANAPLSIPDHMRRGLP